ncbi:hypothetical protein V6V47_14160 [Micromonospora sp. CPCC 205539]
MLAGIAPTQPALATAADPPPPVVGSEFSSQDVGIGSGHLGGADRQMDGIRTFLPNKSPIVRIELDWWYVEDYRGSVLRWDRIDPLVMAAKARGMRVLLILAYAPPWANGNHNVPKVPVTTWFPTNDDDWKSIVERTAAHFELPEFGNTVKAYEVWNEPNMVGSFGNYESDRKTRYWQMVRIANKAVHSACVTCVVVAGGSARGVESPAGSNPDESAVWLDWAYVNGYGDDFDAVALHPYSEWPGPGQSTCATPWSNMFGPPGEASPCGELARVHAVMVRHGDVAKKIWATEIGFPAQDGTPYVQDARANMVLAVQMWRALSYTGPFIVYNFQDACEPVTEIECQFGVVNRAFQPKEPLYSALSTALRHDSLLTVNQQLQPDAVAALHSVDGRFALSLQPDGNLVLRGPGSTVRWTSNTFGDHRLINQSDGNLVLYRSDGTVVWSSNTWSSGPSTLTVQNDGNLVLRRNSDSFPVWSSRTATLDADQQLRAGSPPLYSADLRFALSMQTDGNLVINRLHGGAALWAAGTNNGHRLMNQSDGNLVLVAHAGSTPVWSSGTWAAGPSTLRLQSDGNLVLRRNSDGVVTWTSGTFG